MLKVLKFLVFSNLYVALPVTFLVFQTYILFDEPLNSWLLLGTYSGTLFIYNFHRLRGLENVLRQDLSDRHIWARNNKPLLIGISITGFGLGLFSSWYVISKPILNWMYFPAIIAIGYVVPFFKVKGRWYRLRDIPFLKAVLIAFTVSWVTVFIPMSNSINQEAWMVFFERFFFLLAITIPFDVRDMVFDSHSKLKTIPTYFGVRKSKIFSIIFLLFSLVFSLLSAFYFDRNVIILGAFLLSAIFCFWVILKSNQSSSEFHYSFLVEGTMILQTILVWGAELGMLL